MLLAVRSLARTITLQFVVILAPIALVLVYQLVGVTSRASEAQDERAALATALRAQRHYKTFIDGVVDAVDTGRIGSRTHQALDDTVAELRGLRESRAGNVDLAVVDDLGELARAVALDPTIAGLMPHRPAINAARTRVDALVAMLEQRVQDNVMQFVEATENQQWTVLGASAASLFAAVGSILLLIRGLTTPLNQAVTLAEVTAAGRFDDDAPVDTRHDIGGLLHSLVSMRAALSRSFTNLARSERRLANAQRMATIGDWELIVTTQAVTMSESAAAVLHLADPSATSRGFPLHTIHPDDQPAVAQALEGAQRAGTPFDLDFRVVCADGEIRYVHGQGQAVRDAERAPHVIHGTVQDISARKRAEQKAQYLALHDNVTGLPNRTFFQAHAGDALTASARAQHSLAVLFVDVDGFKRVNDTFGHACGDAVLREVGRRLQSCVRGSDLVCHDPDGGQRVNPDLFRVGGDEFTLVLSWLKQPEDAAVVARRIQVSLRAPCIVDGRAIPIGASIGIAVAPADGHDLPTLVKHADIAMYHSKAAGGGRFHFYSDAMQDDVVRQAAFEAELVAALADGQFVLHYQLKVDAATQASIGVEALVRWQHPTRGLLGPGEFIPVAERIGLIHSLGEWVLHTACRDVKGWHDAGMAPVSVAVNVSAASAAREDIVDQVTKALAMSGLAPGFLELELTESIMMDGAADVIERLRRLKAMGVSLSLDDFGTGYSCLAHLPRLPVDTLKIDRAFVGAIGTPDGMALVATIVAMARQLSLCVVAEGVETFEQATTLKSMRCDLLQGFLFSRPSPADEVAALIRSRVSQPGVERLPVSVAAEPGRG